MSQHEEKAEKKQVSKEEPAIGTGKEEIEVEKHCEKNEDQAEVVSTCLRPGLSPGPKPSWMQVAAVVDRLASLLYLAVALFNFFCYLFPLLNVGFMQK